MFKIQHPEFLAPGIKRFVIEAPRIARKQKPGQFVILRLYEQGERIPITIEHSDPERGTIRIVVQSAGLQSKVVPYARAAGRRVAPWGYARCGLSVVCATRTRGQDDVDVVGTRLQEQVANGG